MMNVARAASLVLYHTVYGPVAAIVREDSTPQGIANLFVLDRDTPQNVDVVPFGSGEGCWSWPENVANERAPAPVPAVLGKLVPAEVPTAATPDRASTAATPDRAPVRNMSPDLDKYAAPAGAVAVTVDQASRELADDPITDGSAEVDGDGNVENIL